MSSDRVSVTIDEQSILMVCLYLVTVPNRHAPPAMLWRESCREGGKVCTRTLANLTAWASERIEALRRALQGEFDGLSGDLTPTCGAMFAVLCVFKQLADRLGLTRVLGTERLAKLAWCWSWSASQPKARASRPCGGPPIMRWRRCWAGGLRRR
jgi:hypothetical protein